MNSQLKRGIKGNSLFQNLRTQRLRQQAARFTSADFAEVEQLCLFLGHGRSGHSIVGALLDAHPEIVLADEIDVTHFIEAGFNRTELLGLLCHISEKQAEAQRAKQGGVHRYHVSGAAQGRRGKVRVMGSSKAGVTTVKFGRNPHWFSRLPAFLKTPVHYIQIVRNPFDNIATISLRRGLEPDTAIEQYRRNTQQIGRLRRIADNLLTLRHESLIADPSSFLTACCHFLRVEPTDDYLSACAAIIYDKPNRSRHNITWTAAQKAAVQTLIDQTPFLHGYTFDS